MMLPDPTFFKLGCSFVRTEDNIKKILEFLRNHRGVRRIRRRDLKEIIKGLCRCSDTQSYHYIKKLQGKGVLISTQNKAYLIISKLANTSS